MRTPRSPLDVTLPITPMLDTSFQLLSFFVLTFHPRPAEGQLAVALPPAAAGVAASDTEWPADPATVEYTITVAPAAGGVSIGLRGPTGAPADVRSLPDLRDALAALPKPAGAAIVVEVAADLPYALLIDVLDACRKAGYPAVNIGALRSGPA